MPKPADFFVSLILPICRWSPETAGAIEQVIQTAGQHFPDHEIILLDDHLDEVSENRLNQCLNRHKAVRIIRLAKNYGLDAAISVGLDYALGDYVVVFQPEEDPAYAIPEIVAVCQQGADIVYGTDPRRQRRRGPAALMSHLYYWYLKQFIHLDLPRYTTRLRCMNRAAVQSLKKTDPEQRHYKYLNALGGFDTALYPYHSVSGNAPAPSLPVSQALSEGISVIIENSPHPLRMISSIGLIIAMIGGGYFVYALIDLLFGNDPNSQTHPFSVMMSFMMLCMLLLLIALSEYIGRLFSFLQKKPGFRVESDKRSAVMLSADRLNVIVEGHQDD